MNIYIARDGEKGSGNDGEILMFDSEPFYDGAEFIAITNSNIHKWVSFERSLFPEIANGEVKRFRLEEDE